MNDEIYIRQALEEAQKSIGAGEVPVGAVVVSDGEILSLAHNQTISSQDPTAHAEIVAMRRACQKINNYRLTDCDLYVTLEPCPMCAGALILSRIERVVFGAYDPKGGSVGSLTNILEVNGYNHKVDYTGGIEENSCSQLLTSFFKNIRKKNS